MDERPDAPGRDLTRLLAAARRFLSRTLDLTKDANVEGTVETIRKDMVFAGPNVWVLICSIFIASIGLNTNSTAVIIGAMLISPLMGPILAIGLSVGVNDLGTLRRALRHFAVMTLVALVTSTLYFLITPLADTQPELLARTRPTILDAAIALFGGVAGIIGVSRRDRGNVIPGVAIATALMPPLCTAGFGLANANWPFFFGALYLFALNSIFIATATVLVVRLLRFPFVEFLDDAARRRVRLRITGFAVVVLIPSVWIMTGVVKEGLFRRKAADFLTQNLASLPGVGIVSQRIQYADSLSTLEVVLMGDSIPAGLAEQLQARMAAAGLENTRLRLHVPGNVAGELGRLGSELRVGIVQDLYERQAAVLREREDRIVQLEGDLARLRGDAVPVEQLSREIAVQYPGVARIAFGQVVEARRSALEGTDSALVVDTVPTVLVSWRAAHSRAQRAQDQTKLGAWLRVRLSVDTLQVIGR